VTVLPEVKITSISEAESATKLKVNEVVAPFPKNV
jgi:hypothetical protein